MSSTRRLLDGHGREAPGERGVALDLAVLGERRRADHAQLTAGEHRLEDVGGVHRALGVAGAEHGVQLVDEQDDLALGRRRPRRAPPSGAARTGRGTGRRRPCRPGRARRRGRRAASRARRRRRCAGPGPRRWRSCRRRPRRSARRCSCAGGRGSRRSARSPRSRPMTGSIRPVAGVGGQVAAELVQRGGRLVRGAGSGARHRAGAARTLHGLAGTRLAEHRTAAPHAVGEHHAHRAGPLAAQLADVGGLRVHSQALPLEKSQ